MVVVAAPWEFGWNTPIKEVDLWKYPLRDFGVDHLAMCPVSGIKDSFVKEYESVERIIEEYSHLPLIIVDEKGENDLESFSHPENALYLFGKTTGSVLGFADRGTSLKITTPADKGLLWGHQAASIILYHRWRSQ